MVLTRTHDADELHEVVILRHAMAVDFDGVACRLDHVHRGPYLVPAAGAADLRSKAGTSHQCRVWSKSRALRLDLGRCGGLKAGLRRWLRKLPVSAWGLRRT